MLTKNDIGNVDQLVQKLSNEKDKWMSMAIAVDLADEILKGLLPDNTEWQAQLTRDVEQTGNLPNPLPTDIFKTQKQRTWFNEHPESASARVALELFNDKNCVLESKFYWFSESVTKQKISASTEFTANWEDSELTRKPKYKVGIDFFLTSDANSLLLVLSNKSKHRVLELNKRLSNTQKQILMNNLNGAAAYDGMKNGEQQELEPQRTIHTTLWNALQLKEVNNKFYSIVANHFNDLVEKLTSKDNQFSQDNAKQFSSRLLGRLLFVWFLRKMGIINEKIGYFDTLDMTSTEYYNQKLKSLFFETLNTSADNRRHMDYITPYLNGGLFEPKDNDFTNKVIEFPDDYFKDVYEHFDEFNFTTDESSSDYELIAVDPEMLGQVFESLLANQFSDDGKNERNTTGSFYTPREIVDYMCKETLRRYLYESVNNQTFNQGIDFLLDWSDSQFIARKSTATVDLWGVNSKEVTSKIKTALDEIKVIDPACGSGAYPMGMLQLLLKTYERIETRFDPYKLKLSIIENNIFGVDIQPMAVEISRLRAWLSVIVDENDKKNIQPLPNLDFKFVCANTLIKLDDDSGNSSDPLLDTKLMVLRDKYFNARKPDIKKKYKDQYRELTQPVGLFDDKRSAQLKTFDPFKNRSSAEFFDGHYMFGVTGGFDIVIGNPPYLLEGKVNKAVFEGIPYYQANMDLWYSFVGVGIDMLKDEGKLCFIAKNNWVTNEGASIIRNKVVNDSKIEQLIDFGSCMVFESADIQTMIMMFTKNKLVNDYRFDYRKLTGTSKNLFAQDALDILSKSSNKGLYAEPLINREKLRNKYLTFSSNSSQVILDKLSNQANYLSKSEVAQGIVFPQDFLNKKNKKILGNQFEIGDGVFVLSNEEKIELNVPENELDLLKPFYDSTNMHRYYSDEVNNYWAIYTNSKFKSAKSMDKYPVIKSHIDKFKDIITSDNQPYGIHRARVETLFHGEKIVVKRKSVDLPMFSYSDFACFVSQTFNIIKTDRYNMKYLTGLLSSKLIAFWLKNKGKMQGSNYQLDKAPLLQIPIKKPADESAVVNLVDKLIKADKLGQDTSIIEKKIDELVYNIYDLDDNDINIVESEIVK